MTPRLCKSVVNGTMSIKTKLAILIAVLKEYLLCSFAKLILCVCQPVETIAEGTNCALVQRNAPLRELKIGGAPWRLFGGGGTRLVGVGIHLLYTVLPS